MTALPEPKNTTAELIDAYHADNQGDPRPHLGVSLLGHHCDRYLWLNFRWSVIERFNGRMLRLFRRGHNEEQTVVNDLRAIGMDVQSTGSSQARVDFGNHVSGSIDGIIEHGVPEAPNKPHILEIKTHSKKSFDELVSKGVHTAKHQHYVQMQVYMLGKQIDRALYVAVCKDDDRIYTERVRLDQETAQMYVRRGHYIVALEELPPLASADPSWYKCKFCPAHSFCHETQLTKEVNCRTCAHATAAPDSTWTCARWNDAVIPYDNQLTGCPSHVLHPALVPWDRVESDNPNEAVYVIQDKRIRNGEKGPGVYASSELIANATACGDSEVDALRTAFNGEVVG